MNDFKDLTINDIYIVSILPNFRSIRNLSSHLKVSAPATSKRLNLIENILNNKLISRTTTGISITEEGLSLSRWATELFSLSTIIPKEKQTIQKKQKLIIGSRSFLNACLISAFTDCFSDNKLSFIDLSPKDINNVMDMNQIDLSITLEKHKLRENWDSIYIGDLIWELMCNSNLNIPHSLTIEKLKEYNIAHSTFYNGNTIIKGEDFLKVPQNLKNHGHGVQTTSSAISLAKATDQLIFIPKISAREELLRNTLKVINLKGVKKNLMPIYLNFNIDKISHKKLNQLIKNLKGIIC